MYSYVDNDSCRTLRKRPPPPGGIRYHQIFFFPRILRGARVLRIFFFLAIRTYDVRKPRKRRIGQRRGVIKSRVTRRVPRGQRSSDNVNAETGPRRGSFRSGVYVRYDVEIRVVVRRCSVYVGARRYDVAIVNYRYETKRKGEKHDDDEFPCSPVLC